jgi:hypothetical protein
MSGTQPHVTSDDLIIEDIVGSVSFDAISDMESKQEPLLKTLRHLAGSLLIRTAWPGPCSVYYRRLADADTLEDLSSAGGQEGLSLVRGLLDARSAGRSIELRCESPRFRVRVLRDSCRFVADYVQNPDVVRDALQDVLPAVLRALAITEPGSLGIKFRTVLRLQPGLCYRHIIDSPLLRSLGVRSGLFQALSEGTDLRGADRSSLYSHKPSWLISRVSFECPENDDNTTIRVELDTKTVGETYDPGMLSTLAPFFECHRMVIDTLLHAFPEGAQDADSPPTHLRGRPNRKGKEQ